VLVGAHRVPTQHADAQVEQTGDDADCHSRTDGDADRLCEAHVGEEHDQLRGEHDDKAPEADAEPSERPSEDAGHRR